MRSSRPEVFTGYNSITNWQYSYSNNLYYLYSEGVFRAGSAPNQEKSGSKRPPGPIHRVRQPIRVLAVQSKPQRTYKKEKKPKISQFDQEDNLNDSFSIEERPPCRQNTNLFDLEDTFYPKMNGFLKDSGRGIRADIRPPSRHKTPPKALGLEFPPKVKHSEFKSNEFIYQDSSIYSNENESLSNTMPADFGMTEKKPPYSEGRTKPKSARGKKSEKIPVRIWSAVKNKQNMIEVPIVLNKREKNFLNVKKRGRDKRDDQKFEENKKVKSFNKNLETGKIKPKGVPIVPFQTNLEPEFLSLFARSEDFNF